MVAPIQIGGSIQIGGGINIGAGSGTPSLTIASTDFTTGYFAGQNVGTSGYVSNSNGDLICPLYNLSGATGSISTRISDFFTAAGYDIAYSYAFNATWASYTPAPGSMFFNANGYLTAPLSGAFDQNTGSFTVECWFYPTTGSNQGHIYNQNTTGFLNLYWGSDNSFNISQTGYADVINGSGGLPLNTWYHVAMVYDNDNTGNMFLYVNGVSQVPGGATVGSFTSSQDVTGIGANADGGYSVNNAYITNLRVTKAVVYTGDFTPPSAPLQNTQAAGTNISAITAGQVQLLMDATTPFTYIVDSSSNAFTPYITNNGGVSWNSASPAITSATVNNYSGIVRAYWSGSQLNIVAMDPANDLWAITGAPSAGSGLTGTFTWPVTLTPYTPATQLDGNNWC